MIAPASSRILELRARSWKVWTISSKLQFHFADRSARETTFSFRVLREEKNFIAGRVRERAAKLVEAAVARGSET